MNIWESIVLGAIQGLTEFLPVSSSGHLEIANYLFGIEGESHLSFTIAVHLATVLASLVVFRREVGRMIMGVFGWKLNDDTVYFINLLISTLPIIFIGLFFREEIESLFTGNLIFVGAMLILTGAMLTFSQFAKPGVNPITPKRAFIIGLAQAIATVPGLSRSGATISAGLMLGVKRDQVARFSFLMVIIPVLGVCFLDAIKGGFSGAQLDVPFVTGFVTAFVTGLFACKVMIKLVSKGKLIWFAIYCALAGLATISMGVFN